MANGVLKAGKRVITKDGEVTVNKTEEKNEDLIEVKLDTAEIKTYQPTEFSNDVDAD